MEDLFRYLGYSPAPEKVLTQHHRFEIVPTGKGVCASVSDPPADTLLRFGPLPNIKNPCEVEVNPIRPISPSYATSRLGIAETIDYLSNTDFHCINYLLVAATAYTVYTRYTD